MCVTASPMACRPSRVPAARARRRSARAEPGRVRVAEDLREPRSAERRLAVAVVDQDGALHLAARADGQRAAGEERAEQAAGHDLLELLLLGLRPVVGMAGRIRQLRHRRELARRAVDLRDPEAVRERRLEPCRRCGIPPQVAGHDVRVPVHARAGSDERLGQRRRRAHTPARERGHQRRDGLGLLHPVDELHEVGHRPVVVGEPALVAGERAAVGRGEELVGSHRRGRTLRLRVKVDRRAHRRPASTLMLLGRIDVDGAASPGRRSTFASAALPCPAAVAVRKDPGPDS